MVITVLLENPCLASLNENYCKQQLRAMAYVMEQNKKGRIYTTQCKNNPSLCALLFWVFDISLEH